MGGEGDEIDVYAVPRNPRFFTALYPLSGVGVVAFVLGLLAALFGFGRSLVALAHRPSGQKTGVMIPFLTILIAVTACSALVWFCINVQRFRTAITFVDLQEHEPHKKYDAYFTYRNYTGMEGYVHNSLVGDIAYSPRANREAVANAISVWNAREAGTGEAGFEDVLAELERLPKGSLVKTFPNPAALDIRDWSHKPMNPWQDEYYGRLRDVAWRRRLKIYFCVTDERGKLHEVIRTYLQAQGLEVSDDPSSIDLSWSSFKRPHTPGVVAAPESGDPVGSRDSSGATEEGEGDRE